VGGQGYPPRAGPGICADSPGGNRADAVRVAAHLMARADDTVADAGVSGVPAVRFVLAHQAALYAAAAIVAVRAAGTGGPPESIWQALADAEPTLAPSAWKFAAATSKRAAADAGLPRAVSASDADGMLSDARAFLAASRLAAGLRLSFDSGPPPPSSARAEAGRRGGSGPRRAAITGPHRRGG